MKNVIYFFAFPTLLFLFSCNYKDCRECFTPPEAFILELVDQATGENLFTVDSLDSEKVEVIDLYDNKSVVFSFLDENAINLIQIHTIGWHSEVVNYSIQVDGIEMCILHVDAERVDGDCCDHTEFHVIDISNAEFRKDETTGIIKALLSL